MSLNDELRANEPKIISKWRFEALVGGVAFVILIAETIAWVMTCRALGMRAQGGWIAGLSLANFMLARLAVDRVLRRFGLSRSGKTLEVRRKAALDPDGEAADDEIVEVRIREPIKRFLLFSCPLMCIFFVSAATFAFDREPWTRAVSYLMGAFFGLGTLNILWDRKPQAWADRDGVTGYPNGLSSRRFVPWSAVAACEIETYFDTFGKPSIIRPTLMGRDGEPLLTLYLLFTNFEDQERLVKYIRAKLPKPNLDLFD